MAFSNWRISAILSVSAVLSWRRIPANWLSAWKNIRIWQNPCVLYRKNFTDWRMSKNAIAAAMWIWLWMRIPNGSHWPVRKLSVPCNVILILSALWKWKRRFFLPLSAELRQDHFSHIIIRWIMISLCALRRNWIWNDWS